MHLDEGVVVSGMELFLIVGYWQRFCRKTHKKSAKCVFCAYVLCTLYSFPPCGWNLCQIGQQFLFKTVKSGANDMVWLNVSYFTLQLATWLRERGSEGGSVPSPWCDHWQWTPYYIPSSTCFLSNNFLLNSYLYFCAGQAEDPYDAEPRVQPGGYKDDL